MAKPRKVLKINDVDLWYLIGLIVTDGCLSRDGRHIDITAKEYGYLSEISRRLGLSGKVGVKNRARNNEAFHIQIANKGFYEFLLTLGLAPRKSLVLKEIKVPDERFPDFLRGIIDGDGSIRRWIHASNKTEQWSLRVYSSSEGFIEWLNKKIEERVSVRGRIYKQVGREKRVDSFVLKYGKIAAKEILSQCYYEGVLSLERKAKLAQECCLSKSGWKRNQKISLN